MMKEWGDNEPKTDTEVPVVRTAPAAVGAAHTIPIKAERAATNHAPEIIVTLHIFSAIF